MFKCHVCGSQAFHQAHVSEVFNIGGKFRLVENIPAMVCERCGEELFSSETSEHIRAMLNGSDKPLKSISLDVFSFREAG